MLTLLFSITILHFHKSVILILTFIEIFYFHKLIMVVLTRAARQREKEVIEARFRLVLDDIEECRPNKIVLRCIVPLPEYDPYFDGDMENLPQHRESCYEGAYRFSLGSVFWPMTRIPYGFSARAFHLPEFEHDQLKCLYQDKFYLR